MNRAAILLLGLALLGDAPRPTALVAGTVRDQNGAPVASARITLFSSGRQVAVASSESDGTFAATGAADAARIECDYCRSERIAVPSDGIVVAIVHRYEAVSADGPTRTDLERLPYAHIESAAALTPFVVLNESASLFPGPQLSDRRVSAAGGLLVLNGVPDYDVAGNISPYLTIPERDVSSLAIRRTDEAYLYGNTAGGGTFIAGTGGGSPFISGGSGAALRVAQQGSVESSAAYSSDAGGDERARAGANAGFSLPGLSGTATLGVGQINVLPADAPALSSEFSSASLSLRRTSGLDLSGSLSADRGTYYYDTNPYPTTATWSDIDAHAAVRAHAVVSPFAFVDFRRSSAQSTIGQTRGVAGFTIDEPHVNVVAALGSDAVSYGGFGHIAGAGGTARDSVFAVMWSPDAMLSWEASASRGYLLPVFSSVYGTPLPAAFYVDGDSILESTLWLGDARRVKFGLTALRFTDEAGLQSGSAGASLAWQLSPRFSVRTWLLRTDDNEHGAAAVGSTWLTYDAGSVRIDAIVRRDLEDWEPDAHLDASISGPLTRRVTWFVATERRNGVRTTDAGLRF